MNTEQKVRTYILENFMFTDDESLLNDDDSLQEKGLIDSTGLLEVITFIEDEFGVKVADSEMTPDNLDTVNNIVKYVSSKI